MKKLLSIPLIFMLAATSGAAQEETAPEDEPSADMSEGAELLEEGARIILRSLMEEMGATADDLKQFAEEMGPTILELQNLIGDITNYEMPEMLPNGDIIIRRKPDAPAEDDGAVEL